MVKCKCNIMDLIKQRDTADGNHFIRLYECAKCLDKQIDVYKIIESKHIGLSYQTADKVLKDYGLSMLEFPEINFIDHEPCWV